VSSSIEYSGLLITRTLQPDKHQRRDFFNTNAILQQPIQLNRTAGFTSGLPTSTKPLARRTLPRIAGSKLVFEFVLSLNSKRRMISCHGECRPRGTETNVECPIVKKNAIQIP
jgi:hypothetical protein